MESVICIIYQTLVFLTCFLERCTCHSGNILYKDNKITGNILIKIIKETTSIRDNQERRFK